MNMKVFVTGASGYMGRLVVPLLLAEGHQVVGLARSDKSAQVVADLGAEIYRGSLNDTDSLKAAAAASDGVIHLAFIHDFSDYEGGCHADRRAIEAMGTALTGSNKPLIITSGTLLLPAGRLGTEDDFADPDTEFILRGRSETLALSFAPKQVNAQVVRLAPTVHGEGDSMFVPFLISTARTNGVSAYVGDGSARWPSIHQRDAARVFVLALQHGTPGSVYHAVAEEGVSIKELASITGEKLGLPVKSISVEESKEHFTWMAKLLIWDNPTSSEKTRRLLQWSPTGPTLSKDLIDGPYFQ